MKSEGLFLISRQEEQLGSTRSKSKSKKFLLGAVSWKQGFICYLIIILTSNSGYMELGGILPKISVMAILVLSAWAK